MSTRRKEPKEKKEPVAPTLPAAQRIENLEKTVDAIRKMIQVIGEELEKMQKNQLVIAKRLESTLKVASEGDLNEKNVNDYQIAQQVKELKEKVDLLVSQGVLLEVPEITKGTDFVIGQEVNEEGEVISPRTQATIQTLPQEVQDKLMGKKAGDLVSFDQGKLSFLVKEVYSIQSNEAPKTAEV